MKRIIFLLMMVSTSMFAQQKTKNLVVVTLDGYRWKELFAGADEELINTKNQIAKTLAAFLGLDFTSKNTIGETITSLFGK